MSDYYQTYGIEINSILRTILSDQYILPVVVPFVVGILSLALPLTLDASSKVGDKYKSSLVTKAFRNEMSFICFTVMLWGSLISLLLYFFAFPAPQCLRGLRISVIIENSAVLLVNILTILLVSSLLWLSCTINIYYSQNKLLRHLICKYKCWNKWYRIKSRVLRKPNNDFDKSDFIALSILMNFSVENADEELARRIYSFFVEAFIQFRKGKEGEEIEYPDEFYNAIFEASEHLCRRGYKTVSYYNDGSLYEFFIDPFQETKISSKTIRFIWMCALQNIHYGHYDFLFGLWKKIYQQVGLVLSDNLIFQNESDKFVELSHVVCSYLLHLGQFKEFLKFMNYTQFQPPQYVLTPSSVQQVIDRCVDLEQHNDYGSSLFPVYYESMYPHPGVEGADAGKIIQQRLYLFYAVCFLLQYQLPQTFVTSGYNDSISIGDSIDKKQKTQAVIEKLRSNVKKVIENKKLVKALDLYPISFDQAFNGHKSPQQWFDDVLMEICNQLKVQIDAEERMAIIPTNIVEEYENAVQSSCEVMFKELEPYCGKEQTGKNNYVALAWRHDIVPKSRVLKSINFAQVCGKSLAIEYNANFWLPLLKMNITNYTLEKEEALKTAFCWEKTQGLIILLFGVRFDENKFINGDLLRKEKGKLVSKTGINVLKVNAFPLPPALSDSIVLIKQEDLPYQSIEPVCDVTIKELGLKEVGSQYKIYTSVIDFHLEQWESIKLKYTRNNNPDADKYAMFCAYINSKIWYNPKAKLIRLSMYNQLIDRGMPQKQTDVIDVWKESKNGARSK